MLRGESYAKVAASDHPLARIVIENYDLWEHRHHHPRDTSSILYDTAAVYLAYSEDYALVQSRKLIVDENGNTLITPDGKEVRCQLGWKDRKAFDACISLFTSFGYFCDEENQRVLGNVSRSLKENGALLLDLRNVQKGLAGDENMEKTMAVPSGVLSMRIRFDRATRRARAEHTLLRSDGIRISSAFDVRIYSERELTDMIRRAGMRVVAVHGSLDGSPFTPGAERMVVIARR